MSVKRNAIANYVGQLYSLLISVVTLPLFLGVMGPDAYGLVGFYTVVYAWLMIFDLGMTPALSREVANLKSKPESSEVLASIAATFERLFLIMTLAVGGALYLSSAWLADNWLVNDTLDGSRVVSALQFLAFAVALRWQTTVYRSVINGYEAQVWLNGIDIIINSLRFPLLLVVMTAYPTQFELFFIYQAVISAIEILALRWKFSRLLPGRGLLPAFNLSLLKPMLPFALGAAYASALGVTLAQYDKLLLSSILTLTDYGYFALIGVVTGGILTLSGPISKAILPRLTALLASGEENEMLALYKVATRWMVVSLSPLALSIVIWPQLTIFAWSGDSAAAAWVAPVLPLFVAGAALTTITVFQYFLQYAHGDLSLNVRFNTVLFVISVPLITHAAFQYGVVGVAWVVFSTRLISFCLWVPFVHSKLAPGIHRDWLLNSVAKPLMIPFALLLLINQLTGEIAASLSSQLGALGFMALVATSGYGALALWLLLSGQLSAGLSITGSSAEEQLQ